MFADKGVIIKEIARRLIMADNNNSQNISKQLPEDPDKGLAVVALVFAFFMPVVGLILSIVARSKSKKGGYKNPLATIGIIVNTIFILITILFIALMIVFGLFMFDTYKDATKRDDIRKSDVVYIGKAVESYVNTNGYFPSTLDDLKNTGSFESAKLVDPSGVEYSYEATPEGCDKKVDCTGYVITAKLDVVTDGNNTYTYTNQLTSQTN
jgi:preprotein translocase subunit SecG